MSGVSIYVIECMAKFIDIHHLTTWFHFKTKIKESSSRKERKYINLIFHLHINSYKPLKILSLWYAK